MPEAEAKWTEVTVTGPHEMIEDISWPTYDYLWVQHSNGDYYLSRDQGVTFNKVGRLRYRIWKLYRRTRNRFSRIREKTMTKVKATLKTTVQKPVKVSVAEIVCILDRSGSMSRVTEETIAGFNKFIGEQRDLGPGRVTLVLFDDEYELVYEDVALTDVQDITPEVYFTRGSTALLDAVGRTISNVRERHMKGKPEQTLFMIVTDGYENDSKEYTEEGQVKTMVKECMEEHDWKFFFLGADVDAFGEAGSMGISQAYAVRTKGDRIGTQHAYASAWAAMSVSRSGGDLGESGQTMSDLYDEAGDTGVSPAK